MTTTPQDASDNLAVPLPPRRGAIEPENTAIIDCGMCRTAWLLHLEKFKSYASEAMVKGWRKTHKHGWICPKCVTIDKKNRRDAAKLRRATDHAASGDGAEGSVRRG